MMPIVKSEVKTQLKNLSVKEHTYGNCYTKS